MRPRRAFYHGRQYNDQTHRAIMLAHIVIERRLLGFDLGDWSMLFVGLALAGLLALLP